MIMSERTNAVLEHRKTMYTTVCLKLSAKLTVMVLYLHTFGHIVQVPNEVQRGIVFSSM